MTNGDCQFTLKSARLYSFADAGLAKSSTFKRHPKTKLMKKIITLFLALICGLGSVQAQKTVASPRDSVSGKHGDANISINYGSPAVKGRKIWGDLVPYGKVWRTGANEATVFKTDKAIKVEGKTLPAGQYSFFAIPGEKEWVLIFNKTAKQWGAYDYKEADDALRVTVKPQSVAPTAERLKYTITPAGFSLIWENLEIPVSIK